jgi:DNA-binding transcriptional LysR family regulator
MTEANGRKHEPFAKKSHGDKSRVTGPVSAHNMQACRALNVYHTCARVVGFPIRWELARRDRTRPAGLPRISAGLFCFYAHWTTVKKSLDLTRFDLNLLVVMDALLAERHVGRAAERLHLSQSATSHALSRLREALDDPLFVRHPKGIEPTPLAASLAQPINEVLDGVRHIATSRAPFDPSRMRREFVVGTTDYGMLTVLAPALSAVCLKSPGSTVRSESTDQATVVRRLDAGEIDLAIGSDTFVHAPKRIEVIPLFDERFVGIARTGHPCLKRQGRRQAVTLDAFVEASHILVSPRGDARGAVDDALARVGLRRTIAATSPSFITVPFVVGASDLLAAVAERAASRLADAAGIVTFELPFEMPTWTVSLGRAAGRSAESEIEWLTDTIIAAVEP